MSFIARTHPQQGPNEKVDDRQIPKEVFNQFHARFKFTVDAAASCHNALLPRFWTKHTDGLLQPWEGERVWCNPPYSRIRPWVEKAAKLEADIAVMLLPANRTEQAWWQDIIEPLREDGTVHVEFLRGRMRFIAALDTQIRPNQRPPFGVCLVIFQRRKNPRIKLRCPVCKTEQRCARDRSDPQNCAVIEITCPNCHDGSERQLVDYFDEEGRQIDCDGNALDSRLNA